ncbi:hypothetical protein PG991_011850 [Apiospora marii]|uniref:Protein kinase domain-containing protein n=2 Tax=Apiospora marii TaxID=335849 RepID=A0ABR1RFC8_9PEZI
MHHVIQLRGMERHLKRKESNLLGPQTSQELLVQVEENLRVLEKVVAPYEPLLLTDSKYGQFMKDEKLRSLQDIRGFYAHHSGAIDFAAVAKGLSEPIGHLTRTLSLNQLGAQAAEIQDDIQVSGLDQVAKRQAIMRSQSIHPIEFLKGTLRVDEGREEKNGLKLGRYYSENDSPGTDVVVEYRMYRAREDMHRTDLSDFEVGVRTMVQKLAKVIEMSTLAREGSHSLQMPTAAFFKWFGCVDQKYKGRVAFMYGIPPGFVKEDGTLSLNLRTLRHFLQDKDEMMKMPLQQRFKLAESICLAVLDLHVCGWVHKSIRSDHILLIRKDDEGIRNTPAAFGRRDDSYEINLIGFEYSREESTRSDSLSSPDDKENLYRHPDRQGAPQSFRKEHDLYALGLVLLEIGGGAQLEQVAKKLLKTDTAHRTRSDAKAWKERFVKYAEEYLPFYMGSKYSRAVLQCLEGDFGVTFDDEAKTKLSTAFYRIVLDSIREGANL